MKADRHNKIVQLINEYDIDTQEELADRLRDAGFQVTQATVSRDIRELKLSKIASKEGKQKYVIFQGKDDSLNDKYIRVLRDCFLSMDLAQNILVIKTVSGMAMAAAAALDACHFEEIVGTIAGDDTIMCAVKDIERAELLKDKINKLIHHS